MLTLKKKKRAWNWAKEKSLHNSFQHSPNWRLDRQHCTGKWSREIQSTEPGHSDLGEQGRTGRRRKANKRHLLTTLQSSLRQIGIEPYGAAQPCHTHSVSLGLASSMRLFVFCKKEPPTGRPLSLCAFVLKLQRVSETCKQGCQLIRTILHMKHTQYRDTSCSMCGAQQLVPFFLLPPPSPL